VSHIKVNTDESYDPIGTVANRFLKDVANHKLLILLDQGLYRHVLFSNGNSKHMHFTLTTTPGRLVFGGDMGCFVFERSPDMFAFFGSDPTRFQPNFGYWHEKLVAVDDDDGSRQYSVRRLREALESYLEYPAVELTPAATEQVRECIDEAVSSLSAGDITDALDIINSFALSDGDGWVCGNFFADFHEKEITEFTIRYVWACYAIQWGIAEYNKAKAAAVPVAPEVPK
jgi:hypothetical protein